MGNLVMHNIRKNGMKTQIIPVLAGVSGLFISLIVYSIDHLSSKLLKMDSGKRWKYSISGGRTNHN